MASFTFDVTDRAVEYARDVMSTMPGNPGQEVLVNDLIIDGYAVVIVDINGPFIDTRSEYDVDMSSSHPDAISIIMQEGMDAFQEYAERAGEIEGLVDIAFDLL